MNSHSRVLPKPKYRDPNYDSDSSFENYYLNYAEEEKTAPVRDHNIDQAVNDDDHKKEMLTKTHDHHHHHHRRVIRSVRSSNRRIKHTRLSLMTTKPDNSSASDDHDDPMVENVGSSELFIRRVLQKIDVSEQQHRLSMPCNQVSIDPKKFFTREERTRLDNKLLVKAELVDPRGKLFKIYLKKMDSGATSYCYAIGKPWLIIKKENGFEAGMVLDVRVGRMRDGKLCFTLHIVV